MFKFAIADFAWSAEGPADNPRSHLREKIEINGCSMPLEAWEVRVDPDNDVQEPTDDGRINDFELIADAVHADGHFDTVTIEGREYVLIATPFT